jgi:hypothetical protein
MAHAATRGRRQRGRRSLRCVGCVGIIGALFLAPAASAAVKKVPYPEVKVELAATYQPDAAFKAMIARFSAAVTSKDQNALFALVGPTFVWTLNGVLTDELDLGREALHNFKVVFGFRAVGANADAPVPSGPFWDALATFATDTTFYKATNTGNLICNPLQATIADEDVFEQARQKIESGEPPPEWYFTVQETAVAKSPGDRGPPIAKLKTVALPVLSVSPAAKDGQPAPPPEFLEVLLPSARTGWIPASAARPLAVERLCYAKAVDGQWKIVGYDQPQ